MRLAAIRVPGDGAAWERVGFALDDGQVRLANGAIEPFHDTTVLAVQLPGGDVVAADLEGISLVAAEPCGPADHPNGAIDLDHLVIMTPDLDRTSSAVAVVLGLPQRRLRETADVRQAFHRFDPADDGTRGCIVEIVERTGLERTSLWGLVVNVGDLDRCAGERDHVGQPRDAVQPGRRIASVRRDAGLGLAVAFMSPEPTRR